MLAGNNRGGSKKKGKKGMGSRSSNKAALLARCSLVSTQAAGRRQGDGLDLDLDNGCNSDAALRFPLLQDTSAAPGCPPPVAAGVDR